MRVDLNVIAAAAEARSAEAHARRGNVLKLDKRGRVTVPRDL